MSADHQPSQTVSGRLAARQRASALGFARMSGSSIAGRDAAGWVTDFLNAAYYQRPPQRRDVDDLRLALAILTTLLGRQAATAGSRAPTLRRVPPRLRAPRASTRPVRPRGDARPRAAARRRRAAARRLVRGRRRPTTRGAAGGSPSQTRRARAPTTPTIRLRARPRRRAHAAERAPPDEQVWHTYAPVEMPSAGGRRRRCSRGPRRGRTTRPSSAASRRCARAASPGRRSRSRSWPAFAPRLARSSPAAT